MTYKAVALDLDGTLLGSDLTIRPETIRAIDAIRARGVKVILATGRHHTAALPYHHQLKLDTPLICCNGTYAWQADTRQPWNPRPLSREQAKATLALARAHKIHALVYVDHSMTFETLEPHLAKLIRWAEAQPAEVRPEIIQVKDFAEPIEQARHIWKFATTSTDLTELQIFADAVEKEIGLSCEWSAKDRIDVAQTGNSKGRLLGEWLAANAIEPAHAIAFGDSPNDMSMLGTVGLGVAMGHSAAVVQAEARLVTGSNDSSAIADVLAQHILN